MWASSSSLTSVSTGTRQKKFLRRLFMSGPHHLGDGRRELAPLGGVGLELGAADLGERVDLDALPDLGRAPRRLDEALSLQPVERRIQRAFFYLKGVVGRVLEPAGDGVAMAGTPGQGLEDEEVECAGD